jgi:hypothetical protein
VLARGPGWALLDAFVATFFALLVVVYLPTPALASDCTTYGSGYWVKSDGSSNQYGTRAEKILVVNTSSHCALLRIIRVKEDSSNFVEVGWYQDGNDQSLAKCSDTETPHIYVAAMVNNFWKCKQNTAALTTGERYSFKVVNADHDFTYEYYYDSDTTPNIYLGYYNVDEPNGKAFMFDEIHDVNTPYDSLRADFDGVNSLGNQGNWHAFPDPSLTNGLGGSTGWQVCSWSGTTLTVKQNGAC